MTQDAQKIDSGVVGLRFAEETATPGVLPGSPVWYPLDPNSYSDFGQTVTTLVRKPISQSRQNKKGVVTDISAQGGFSIDLTQKNMQTLMKGFMFAEFRSKAEFTQPTAVVASTDTYAIGTTAGFQVGSIIQATGFGDSINSGIKDVTAVNTNVSIAVSQALADETPPAAAKLVCVGFKFTTGDVNIDATGTFPALTSSAKDFTELGLTVGETIFIGGDSAGSLFTTAANNGFKRIRSIAANRIEFDKSTLTMVNETGTGLNVRIYFGRVLKNEVGSLIVRKPVQFERTLGAPDLDNPSQIQSQYLPGSVPNTFQLNIKTADKITCDLAYISLRSEQRTAATGLKSGTRPALEDSDAFNTSTDFSRIKLAKVVSGDEAPKPLFAFMQDATITINNNIKANKAVGVIGAFDLSAGTFDVSGNLTAYFSDVTAIDSVANNLDVTFDIVAAKANAGFCIDVPLITLGDGKLNITQEEAITLPLSMNAASASKLNAATDYTLMFVFYDYLPTLAES